MSEDCDFFREIPGRQAADNNLGPCQRWGLCTHPERPLAGRDVVTPCKGCNESCRGHQDYTDRVRVPSTEPRVSAVGSTVKPESQRLLEAIARAGTIESVVRGEGGSVIIRPKGSRPLPRGVTLPPRPGETGYHPDKGNSPQHSAAHFQGHDGAVAVWAYGLTTYRPTDEMISTGTPYRRHTTLPRTLESLEAGGFPRPHLFVDGDCDYDSWRGEFGNRISDLTLRPNKIGAFGNWTLSFAELMIRQPFAHYYAIFQDDFVMSRNVRQYIERRGYPRDGYLNLYTFPKNQVLSHGKQGWYYSNQKGLGAVALVFDRHTAVSLVSEPHMANKPRGTDPSRRHKFVDGGIVEALRKVGIREYVHNPSLVQHTGSKSTLRNPNHPQATSFRGEGFDSLTLLDSSDTIR